MSEFELIARYFTPQGKKGMGVALGVGDDCALLVPTPGMQLAVSTDMLVAGRHFFEDVDPRTLGHKSLAVNLSDLAACGAQPLAFTLSLALPVSCATDTWLAPFSQGLMALADAHACELVGGDTTQGPLAISITTWGEVPAGQALLRSNAQVGDDIYVSGCLGQARLALEMMQGHCTVSAQMQAAAKQQLEEPTPRVMLGRTLRGIASAAVDVSDGFLGDLRHILLASKVGADIELPAARALLPGGDSLPAALRDTCVLAGGDDYELAFTASPKFRTTVQEISQSVQVPLTRVGCITTQEGLRLIEADQSVRELKDGEFSSFDHFKK